MGAWSQFPEDTSEQLYIGYKLATNKFKTYARTYDSGQAIKKEKSVEKSPHFTWILIFKHLA